MAANDYLAGLWADFPRRAGPCPVVAAKILAMAATGPTLSTADLARVAARTLVMAGDDDAVSAEHTLHLYRERALFRYLCLP